jgi:hypothetical protein
MIRPGDVPPTGWFFDGERNIYHDGSGNFFIEDQWFARPDLLAARPTSPPPPTWADQARMEAQRLRTPWPSYKQAWRQAKTERWLSRYYALFGLPLAAYEMVHEFAQVNGDHYFRPFFAALAWIASWPFAWWWIYYRHLRSVDRYKARAFSIASYAALAVGAHAARVHGERHPATPLGVPDGRGGWQIPPGTPDWAAHRPRGL